jgi:hypothetical protein
MTRPDEAKVTARGETTTEIGCEAPSSQVPKCSDGMPHLSPLLARDDCD